MFHIPKTVKALLFDMDGTLVDTEPIGPRVFTALMQDHGARLSEDEQSLFYKVWNIDGQDIENGEYLKGLLRKYKLAVPPLDLANQFYGRYVHAIAMADELPGVTSILQQAKNRGLKLAIVTSSRRAWVETLLSVHDWDDLFKVMVSEEDNSLYKPDPQPYLVALQKLQLSPEDCVAFENRENGIISGKGAGIFVVGLLAGNEIIQNLKDADSVIQSFSDVNFVSPAET